jgi:hypothetical protein
MEGGTTFGRALPVRSSSENSGALTTSSGMAPEREVVAR